MVGMELEKIGPEIKAMAEFANGDQIGSLDVLQPLFAVKKSAGVEPLAVYTDAPGRIAMASVQDGSVRSIFWGGTVLTAEFVQQIAREAAAGNTGKLSELLRSVTDTPGGAQLLQQLSRSLEEK